MKLRFIHPQTMNFGGRYYSKLKEKEKNHALIIHVKNNDTENLFMQTLFYCILT